MNAEINTVEDRQRLELAALIEKFSSGDGIHATAIDGLRCIRLSVPNMQLPAVYSPSLCVIVQGSKQVLLEDEIYRYAPPQFLAVSVDLPLLGQVIEASTQRPYLCLQIEIDPRRIGELIAQSGDANWSQGETTRGLFVGAVDSATLEAVLRLTRLLQTPKDIPMLAPMMLREIHYRLLSGEYGPSIAQIAIAGSSTQKIGQIIRRIKANLMQPMRVDELAALANMSPSSFHQHFKAVTAMSPLQYQKRLRLTEARQILLSGDVDAASAAYRVGYESASQFSREYARMFGAPPMRDIAGIRGAL
ncbi:MAG TPA: AraC family transcriptional regulator [Povalibacter sp.]|uniref:AraC family transcriptional regulator n=1 Tax=Povalibacter sp. TaxID=1962978 RepID=UPI002CE15FCC|nr:AraC family transcriptional regulator [Povalibacter sp.]HMN44101.1 AraC family transcriptional regulator [Povalibacter sp.]